jgi:hypothetical protein
VLTWLAEPSNAAKTDALEMGEPDLINGLQDFSDALIDPIAAVLSRVERA